ncbi:hypothetical protein ACOMHN_037348 [Nucella lapillus]
MNRIHHKTSSNPSFNFQSPRSPSRIIRSQSQSNSAGRSREVSITGSQHYESFLTTPTNRASNVSRLSLVSATSSLSEGFLEEAYAYSLLRPALTQVQERAVLTSWKVVKSDLEKTGADMFLQSLDRYTETVHLFSKFSNMAPNSIANVAAFTQQVLYFLTSVEKILSRTPDHEYIETLLHDAGDIYRQDGLTRAYVFLLVPVYLEVIKPNVPEWTDMLNTSWKRFIELLCHVMAERVPTE